jgi:cytochrome P450
MVAATKDVSPRDPPLVRGVPLLGSLPHVQKDTLGFLTRARDRGDAVAFQMGNRHITLLSSPAAVEHLLVQHTKNYSKKTRGYDALRKLLGNGLVTAEGDFWKRQRRIAQPAFHRDKIARFADVMRNATIEAVGRWPVDTPFDVNAEMMRLTMRIVGETLLSTDVTSGSDQIGAAITEMLHQAMIRTRALLPIPDVLPTPLNLRFARAKRVLDVAIDGIIQERRRGVDKADLLSMLLHAVDEETGERMSDAQLRDEVMTMFIAGHETTATALSWTLWLLATHPEEEARLRAEIDAALKPDETLTLAHLARMPLLDAVLKESMRLYPPVWVLARFVEQDDVVDGWRLRGGTLAFISQWVVHRHPALWRDADRFVPQRFLDEPEPEPKGKYFPFSAGPRKCIGDQFALLEGRVILVEVLRRARLRMAPGARVVPEPVVTLRPQFGVSMVRHG